MIPNSRVTTSATFPASTIDRCLATLAGVFNDYVLSSGAPLYCTDRMSVEQALSAARLPVLAFTGYQVAVTPDNDERDRVAVVVLGLIKVQASKAGEGPAIMRRVLDDLLWLADMARGLPVDRDGRAYLNDADMPYRVQRDEIRLLVDRGGPYVRAGQVVDVPGSPSALCNLTIGAEWYQYHALHTPTRVRETILGVQCLSPYHRDGYTAASPAEASGGFQAGALPYVTVAPAIAPLATMGDPPFPNGTNETPITNAIDPARQLLAINVAPYALAIAVAGTSQLGAIGQYADGHAEVLPGATWATSSAGVATVSAAGVVTGAGVGSATITAAYLGVTSNACAVTVT